MQPTDPTVVVIDDDESVRKALRRLVASFGLSVESFASAEEYLAAPGTPAPACLIADVRLPGMNGLELQRRLTAAGRPTPVVFISAHADEQARREAREAGAVAFLQKPFDERLLLEAMVRSMGKTRQPAVPQ